jgi:hypothetical protein
MFDLLLTIVSVINVFSNAYYAAFGLPATKISDIVLDISIEMLFVLDMIFNFFQEVKNEETFEIDRSFLSIALRYAKRSFLFDFVAFFPVVYIFDFPNIRIARLLKLLRIPRLSQLLDVESFKTLVADHHNRNLLKAVEQDNFGYYYPIVNVINAVYKYKITSLLVIILSLAYFLGLIWIIITKDFLQEKDNFYQFYHEDDSDDLATLIKTTYFALTTLSTIGFGDFSPRTTYERIIWSVVLLSGVTCLSIIINNLMDMVRGF